MRKERVTRQLDIKENNEKREGNAKEQKERDEENKKRKDIWKLDALTVKYEKEKMKKGSKKRGRKRKEKGGKCLVQRIGKAKTVQKGGREGERKREGEGTMGCRTKRI